MTATRRRWRRSTRNSRRADCGRQPQPETAAGTANPELRNRTVRAGGNPARLRANPSAADVCAAGRCRPPARQPSPSRVRIALREVDGLSHGCIVKSFFGQVFGSSRGPSRPTAAGSRRRVGQTRARPMSMEEPAGAGQAGSATPLRANAAGPIAAPRARAPAAPSDRPRVSCACSTCGDASRRRGRVRGVGTGAGALQRGPFCLDLESTGAGSAPCFTATLQLPTSRYTIGDSTAIELIQ